MKPLDEDRLELLEISDTSLFMSYGYCTYMRASFIVVTTCCNNTGGDVVPQVE
jgi:hypothetical protein